MTAPTEDSSSSLSPGNSIISQKDHSFEGSSGSAYVEPLRESEQQPDSSAPRRYSISSQSQRSQRSSGSRFSNLTGISQVSSMVSAIRDDRLLDADDKARSSYAERGRSAASLVSEELNKSINRNVRRRRSTSISLEGGMTPQGAFAEGKYEEEEQEEEIEEEGIPQQDKGFAWFVALCSMLAAFSTWGANAGYGVFLGYYLTNNIFPGATKYDFALIGSLVKFLGHALSAVAALVLKVLGFKLTLCVAIVLQTLGYMLASISTKIWQLYLTQGLLVGLGFVLVYIPASLVLPEWFKNRRATAFGICVSGTGLGGVVFALSINNVIERSGSHRWALRMVGFVVLFATIICALGMKHRRKRNITLKESLSSSFITDTFKIVFDFRVFNSRGMVFLVLWYGVSLMGYTLMIFTLSSYATSVGLTAKQGSNLTAILNGFQVIGRPIIGAVADRIGRANTAAIVAVISTVFMLAFWINASTYGALIAFSVLSGMIIGFGTCLSQPLCADLLEDNLEMLPAGWSGLNMFVSPAVLVVQVIALALVREHNSRPYLNTQIFAGAGFFACFILIFPVREHLIYNIIDKRLSEAEYQIKNIRPTTTAGYLKASAFEESDKLLEQEVIRSNQAELTRIITGIRDDRHLDEVEKEKYRERNEPDYILASQLDLASIHTRPKSTTDLESAKNRSLHYEASVTDKSSSEEEIDQGPPLDKGIAWLMAICGTLAVFSTWGASAGFGVFLNFYLSDNTFPGASKYDFALVGGTVMCLANILSPFGALLYKMLGFKLVCILGICLQTAGYILASFATKFWQLYLTQGVVVGVSFVLIFIPVTLVLPTWFLKHKATSMGIVVSGAGLGGLVFSLSINRVIEQTGDQRWALRMVGFVTLFASLLVAIVLKPRNQKPVPLKEGLSMQFIKQNVKLIFDPRVFKSPGLCYLAMWFAIALTGYTLMLFSLSSFASSIGLTHSQGSVLTSVMNAAQTVGRPCMGLLADKLGRANFTGLLCLLNSIVLYAFWINATSYGALIAFSTIIGLIIGVGSSMAQPLLADILEDNLEKLPAGWSGVNIFVSPFCLLAEVIALALVTKGYKPYLHTQIFAGTCFFSCFILMFLVREFLVRRLLSKRLLISEERLNRIRDSTESLKSEPIPEMVDNVDEESDDILEERITRYNGLLQGTTTGFFMRMLYPIRI
ncbi:putative transporter ESBP6 [Spathaspora sp. JA1]|nr:putative transporter ESBP6 [Spathaspora sp. JA1]